MRETELDQRLNENYFSDAFSIREKRTFLIDGYSIMLTSEVVYKALRAVFCVVCILTLSFCAILILQISFYIFGLYLGSDGEGETECLRKFLRSHKRGNSSTIPRHIHQIYFTIGQKKMAYPWVKAQKTWRYYNSDFKYTLWDSEKVVDLLTTYYPEILTLYNSYSHWIMQIDVARLVILYHYGGVYADMDVKSNTWLSSFYKRFSREDAILYYTKPVGVASDFMLAKTGSEFMAHVICGLEPAQRRYVLPYVTEMLSTGPFYIYLRFLTYPRKDDVSIFDSKVVLKYIGHIDGRSWHQWDSAAVWWLFIHRGKLVTSLVVLVVAAVLILCCRRTLLYRWLTACRLRRIRT